MVCDQARKTTTFKMICLVEDEDERGDPTRFISTTRRNSLAQSMAAGRTLVNFSLLLFVSRLTVNKFILSTPNCAPGGSAACWYATHCGGISKLRWRWCYRRF